MRRIIQRVLMTVTAVLGATGGAFAFEAPFSPIGTSADYVMDMKDARGDGGISAWTVKHRGDWTRIDFRKFGQPGVMFLDREDAKSISVERDEKGKITSFEILRGLSQYPLRGWGYGQTNLGKQETHLGETCTIWRVDIDRDQGRLNKLSCVTADGIEIWSKFADGKETSDNRFEATSLERRAMPPTDVLPPSDLLDMGAWSQTAPAHSSGSVQTNPADVVVEIEGTIVRRHYPWMATESGPKGGWRYVSVMNVETGLRLSYSRSPEGRLTTLTMTTAGDDSSKTAAVPIPEAEMPKETIFGLECSWFDAAPGMRDGSESECRTLDGITLKKSSYSQYGGFDTPVTATLVDFHDVSLDDILPREVMSKASWSLPE